MGAALIECRKFLEGRYRKLLSVQTGFRETIDIKDPSWLNVSLDNLGRTSKDGGHGAVLVDPEIGMLLYVIEYEKDQDVVALIVKALSLRSRLALGSDKSSDKLPKDRLGSWRVALYWLIEQDTQSQHWETAVAQLRADAPHMEEIPIDSICKGKDGWPVAFQSHGFPRLLLNVRRVLNINSRADMERWSAADALVEDELRDFSNKFTDKTQRELALSVERKMLELKTQVSSRLSHTGAPNESFTLPHTVGIRSFRNIKEATIELASDSVRCSVIAGPNGCGKSAMFEAISLATFGVSHRYFEYIRDPDAASKRSPEDYVGRYLKNLTYPQWGDPKLHTADQWESIKLPPLEQDVANAVRISEGCLLSQERSTDFCKRSSSDLAADVLRGYSDLANGIQWYVEDEYQKANSARQELLRSFQLRANITKVDTAHQKVAERQLENAVQFSTSSVVAWLIITARDYADLIPGAERTGRLWQRWEERRRDVAAQSVVLLEEALARDAIEKWLLEYNAALADTRKLLSGPVATILEHLRMTGSSFLDQLSSWGLWLEQQAQAPVGTDTAAIELAKRNLDDLSKQQAEITKRGSLLKARLDHLNNVRSGIESRWIEEHAETCPTCNSELGQRGGLRNVIDDLVTSTSTDRGELENQFRGVSGKIREVNEQLRRLGVAENPVGDDQQQVLVRLLGPFLATGVSVEQMLKAPSLREHLISFINHVRGSPALSPDINAEQIATETAKAIIDQCAKVSTTFNAPNNWAVILKRLSETLGNVVKSHLPNTLEALWLELVLNLTAAPWLLRLRPSFHVRTQRNAQSLTIRVGSDETSPLARHILNQAEISILGLAWFFVRFVTSGRFVMPLLVLDDPAQQMDQTTYRDMCRMLETIVRIYRGKDSQLALVVLFHQEDRALDAARALNAALTVLSWSESQSAQSIRHVKVWGDTPPLTPAAVLV